jgi:hypothetical protein
MKGMKILRESIKMTQINVGDATRNVACPAFSLCCWGDIAKEILFEKIQKNYNLYLLCFMI